MLCALHNIGNHFVEFRDLKNIGVAVEKLQISCIPNNTFRVVSKVQVMDPRKKATVLRSNLMRLYFPVESTNLIMIEKLVLATSD